MITFLQLIVITQGGPLQFLFCRRDRYRVSVKGVGGKKMPVIDPDVLTIAFLLLVVVLALMIPPGPGTPLRSPTQAR